MEITVANILAVLTGALVAGFTTGFAGFGTGLVASGLWFHALPAHSVPPLVVLASVAAQLVALASLKLDFDWKRLAPYLAGGLLGVPLGIFALAQASPQGLRLGVGAFLVVYALARIAGLSRLAIGNTGGAAADGAVGLGGGFLGGFAGLSGALPIVWLQLRGGSADHQRAVYQPFNLIVLGAAGLGMLFSGHIGRGEAQLAALSLPATVAGAWFGGRLYRRVREALFHRVVLVLLLASGALLIIRSGTG